MAQLEGTDSLRTYQDVAWVGLRGEGRGVSGNPLNRATSVIQFNEFSAMAGQVHILGMLRAQQRNNGYGWHFFPGESLISSHGSNNSVSPHKSLVPREQPT